MPNIKKKPAEQSNNKKELQLGGTLLLPNEILPWELDLLTPVIETLRVVDSSTKEQADE